MIPELAKCLEGRAALALAWLAIPAVLACKGFGAPRSPECNEKINRCVAACADNPAVLEPRNQPAGPRTRVTGSCEERCNRC